MDTIFALATAYGKAGVAIIRISGPSAWDAGLSMFDDLPLPRVAGLKTLFDSKGRHLDDALVLAFSENSSFTGEQVLELQLHGSTAIVAAVLKHLSDLEGLRLAEAGEFTRRALENGKMDLSQVEGLADLIEAETEAQRLQAQRVFAGELGKKADEWRANLIRAAALLEATIDFADEDVPFDVTPEVTVLIEKVLLSLHAEMQGVATAERIRTGFEVAIVGAPNVGKSTLLNALAGRDAAITSQYAGTTRDVIEVKMDIGGIPVTLLDTAGLREAEDFVEIIGIERAKKRAWMADIRVFLTDGEEAPDELLQPHDIVLRAKADLYNDVKNGISGVTGLGVTALVDQISLILKDRVASIGVATRERHRVAMERSVTVLIQAQGLLVSETVSIDIVAEEIRTGIRALDSLVGRVDVENLLDEIFSSFCIGK